ncbi:MAG: hypothetical protein ACTSWY_03005 [Promethearchaeota archaeon]
MDRTDLLRRDWPIIAHLDLLLNLGLLNWWCLANNFTFWFYFLIIIGMFYVYHTFNKKSYLHRKFIDYLTQLDKKSIYWARQKLKYNPGHKLAKSILPLSMVKTKEVEDVQHLMFKRIDVLLLFIIIFSPIILVIFTFFLILLVTIF